MQYGRADTIQNCFCKGFSRIFEALSPRSKGSRNAITADLPPADGHQNVTCIQCTGIKDKQSCTSASGTLSCILPATGDQCRKSLHQHDDLSRRSSSAVSFEGEARPDSFPQCSHSSDVSPGFSSVAFSFLWLPSPNGNTTDSVPYFITSVFSP